MKTTSLQALIRVNAAMITEMHYDAGYLKDFIKHIDNVGRNAQSEEVAAEALNLEYGAVTALRTIRPQLTKFVEIQKELKAELAYIHRMNRIDRGLAKLANQNVVLLVPADATSHQLEGIVNDKLREVYPPKPDSRKFAA